MEKKKRNIWQIIQLLSSSPQFWTVVGTVVMAIWAGIKGWFASFWAPLTIPVILIVIALTFYIAKQVKSNKRERGITELSPKELITLVNDWIGISSWQVRKLDLISGSLLSFEVTSGKAVIHIERREKEPKVIELVTRMQLVSEKTTLSVANWEKISGEVSIEMARLGIQFRFIGSPNTWDSIELIDAMILEDTLTPFYFRSRVMFVIRAMILVQEVFKKSLREIELFE